MMDNLKAEAEVFRFAAARFEIDEESWISTLYYLGNKLNELGANVNDVAVQFRIPRSLASRILEGTVKPDEVAAWRPSTMAQLVQDVYHDIDSYRHGLLCCQIDDPLNISISALTFRKSFETSTIGGPRGLVYQSAGLSQRYPCWIRKTYFQKLIRWPSRTVSMSAKVRSLLPGSLSSLKRDRSAMTPL